MFISTDSYPGAISWNFSMLPFQCYYCCYHQFWLVDLIGWPISVVGSDWLVGWGSHRLLIGLLELDLFGSFLLCPVLLMTPGIQGPKSVGPGPSGLVLVVGPTKFWKSPTHTDRSVPGPSGRWIPGWRSGFSVRTRIRTIRSYWWAWWNIFFRHIYFLA